MATPSSPPLRSPLSTRTNSPTPDTPSPTPYATAKTTQARPLRRQLSFRTFHPQLDSSESDPSAHSSIFEAFYLTPSAVANLGTDLNATATKRTSARPSSGSNAADGNDASTVLATAAARESWIGTPLEPIAEQNSVATLRAVASLPHLRSSRDRRLGIVSKPSSPALALLTQHKHSFSLDDLPLRPRPRRRRGSAALNTSDSTTASSLPHLHEDHEHDFQHELERVYSYTHPNEPTASPPHRIPTPEGLPSFNTPAAHNYRIPTPPFRLRHLFTSRTHHHHHHAAAATLNAHGTQTVGLPRGVVARGPNGVVRARWRPTQSGHTGQFGGPGIANHPFHAAKTPAEVGFGVGRPSVDRALPGLPVRVRREPRSARARGTMRFVPAVVPPTATELYHRALSAEPGFSGGSGVGGGSVGVDADGDRGHARRARGWQEVADRSRWEGFCEFMCVACCGVERPGTGEEMAMPVAVVGGEGETRARRYGGEGLGGYVP